MSEKIILFDASSLISLSMNGLLGELKKLKEIFKGKFIITQEIKGEVVDKPIKIKRFELEALRIKQLISEGVLEFPESLGIDDVKIHNKSMEIIELSNGFFTANKKPVKLIHLGEASCLALSKLLDEKKVENVLCIDERTTRMLAEKPLNLKDLLQKKLHTRIELKKENFDYFKSFKVIRSAELIYIAYKKGLVEIKDGNLVLDALLYALKFKGCAISFDEIEEIKKIK
jgi:hypothetical protein